MNWLSCACLALTGGVANTRWKMCDVSCHNYQGCASPGILSGHSCVHLRHRVAGCALHIPLAGHGFGGCTYMYVGPATALLMQNQARTCQECFFWNLVCAWRVLELCMCVVVQGDGQIASCSHILSNGKLVCHRADLSARASDLFEASRRIYACLPDIYLGVAGNASRVCTGSAQQVLSRAVRVICVRACHSTC